MHGFVLRSLGLGLALALLAGLLAGAGIHSRVSAQGASVAVTSLTTNVGSLAKVEVQALDVGPPGLAAWTIDVAYDPAVVTVLGCTATQNGYCNPNYAANVVRVTGTNVSGLLGDTVLASIGLACAQPGTSDLAPAAPVFADATIGDPRDINPKLQHGSVTCLEAGVPTPPGGPTPTATPPGSEPKLPGDADCDGDVDAIDAALILQDDAGLIGSVPCKDDADYNHDGSINAIDAALTLQKTAGLI